MQGNLEEVKETCIQEFTSAAPASLNESLPPALSKAAAPQLKKLGDQLMGHLAKVR